MSDMQKAVEAAARAMCNSQSCKSAFHADGKIIVDRWTFIGGAKSETGRWWMDNAKEALAAALPHLASVQPQPSESDKERAREILKRLGCTGYGDADVPFPDDIAFVASFLTATRSAALDECEAIARDEETANASVNGTEAARRIKKKIAALKRP